MHLKRGIASVCLAALVAMPTMAGATNGFLQIGIGPKTRGLGGAGIAYAQDAWSVARNPAGMVHVGCRFDVGVPWVKQKATAEFTLASSSITDKIKSDEDLWWPQLAINYMLQCDQSVGLAAYVAGQSRIHWDKRWPTFDGDPGHVDFLHIFVVPSWSWQVDCSNSIGVNVNLAFSRLEVKGFQGLRGSSSSPLSLDPTRVTNNGDDWEVGLGATIGWTYQILDCIRIGATYHTKTWLGHFHKYRGLLPNRGQADLPARLGLGLAWFPRCNVVVAFDVDKYFWRDGKWFENTDDRNIGGTLPPELLLGANEGRGLGWNEQLVYRVGIGWDVTECWTLRIGFNYANSVVPPGNNLSVLMPETLTQHVTLGASYRWCSSEVSIVYVDGRDHDVNGDVFVSTGNPPDRLDITSWQRSIGVAYSRCF